VSHLIAECACACGGDTRRGVAVKRPVNDSQYSPCPCITNLTPGSECDPLKRYPDKLAWQIDIPKDALKKSENMQALHKFMVQANEAGLYTLTPPDP
jgi:hypothetical protein